MRSSARVAAAIDILDHVLLGAPAEKVLTNWARSNRYAGSGDRAAIRDIVFDCLRNRESFMFLSGQRSGRGLAIGRALHEGHDLSLDFNSDRFSASEVTDDERTLFCSIESAAEHIAADCLEWLVPQLKASLGDRFEAVMQCLKTRAPMDLRVNIAKSSKAKAQQALRGLGIETIEVDGVPNALRAVAPSRKLASSAPYLNGDVELQDAGAQLICERLPADGGRVLDYCAGGGGKALALAARAPELEISAFDLSQSRLEHLVPRADRAGARINCLSKDPVQSDQKYNLLILDVPCSGSGSWRRNPDAKWRLTKTSLDSLRTTQAEILDKTKALVQPGGHIAYITCSLLDCENGDQVDHFLLKNTDWIKLDSLTLLPSDMSDGFYYSLLKKQL